MNDIKFLKSCFHAKDFPFSHLKEVAFFGKSNVGKSSLINMLARMKLLAKTSKTPGLTKCLNFFDYKNTFMLVDLPGYGYAKVPENIKASWEKLMLEYIKKRERLSLCLVLIDSRRGLKENDFMLINLLNAFDRKFSIVFTKSDKANNSEKAELMKSVDLLSKDYENFVYSIGSDENKNHMFASVKTKSGYNEIMRLILNSIK